MATYRQDITRSIEPAMANPATLAKAAEARAGAAKTLAGFAGDMYGAYVSSEMANVEEEAAGLAGEFFVSNQAARAAGVQAGQIAEAAQGTLFESLNRPQMPEAQGGLDKQLQSFDTELNRLKLAAEGGMSNEQYVSRIDSLTKKAIAKFPGMADQIRQRVGSVTGLPGADRWAQMQYVRERFTPPQAERSKMKTPEELAIQDIDEAAKAGMFGTREELLTLYRTDRAKYNARMASFKEVLATQTQTNIIKNQVGGLREQSDLQADGQRASFMAVFSGGLGTSVLTQAVQDKEKVFGTVLKLMGEGKNMSVDIVPFQTQITLHNAQMRTNIEGARRQAYTAIDTYLANNPNISDAKRKELYADVDRAASVALSKYADDKGVGLAAMAAILRTYRDKSLAEKTQLVDLAIKQQSAMQNNPLVMQYWTGGEARENLKRTNRAFYEFMVGQERELTESIGGVRNDIKAATDLAGVERVVVQSQQDSGPVPVDPVASPNVTRAAHQAVMASAIQSLQKAELTPMEVTLVSSALSTSTLYGANSQILAREHRKLGDKILALPEQDQGVIKDNVSRTIRQAVIDVQGILQTIEAKHKVKLTLGVNDAGEISVVVPQGGQRIAAPRLGTSPGMFTHPSTAESLAAAEFMKQAKPLLNNMVFGRAMLTKETPATVGKDFATIIGSNQPYGGFYTLSPTPVTPAAPAAQPASAAQPVPKVGEIVNGWTYNGGDPTLESSWSKK